MVRKYRESKQNIACVIITTYLTKKVRPELLITGFGDSVPSVLFLSDSVQFFIQLWVKRFFLLLLLLLFLVSTKLSKSQCIAWVSFAALPDLCLYLATGTHSLYSRFSFSAIFISDQLFFKVINRF